jgi:AmmeMemoRadiSam system protein A
VDVFIPPDSQRRLVHLSRQTLYDFVRGIEGQNQEISDSNLQRRNYGAFVSLHKKGELRGCIGNCAPLAPLYQLVIDMTRAAASRDSRMAPIAEDELDDIHIDITVLSPLVRVNQPLSLEIGKHGLYVEQTGRHAVLLPQVAMQYHWDMRTFLQETCIKAGLKKNAWKDATTEVSAFTALIIEEEG